MTSYLIIIARPHIVSKDTFFRRCPFLAPFPARRRRCGHSAFALLGGDAPAPYLPDSPLAAKVSRGEGGERGGER